MNWSVAVRNVRDKIARAGLRQRLAELTQNKWVRLALKALQAAFVLGVIVYLAIRLNALGWAEVWAALPATPWFYVFFALRYLALPASELLIYEQIWRRSLRRCFPVFLRKRVYNFGVLGYSGEAYLCMWARRQEGISERQALSAVKDNNILSALVSNAVTALMIVWFAAGGQLSRMTEASPQASFYFALAVLLTVGLTAAAIGFRRRLLAISPRTTAVVLAIHTVRMAVVLALLAGQYAVAIPEAPWTVWLVFLTAQLVLDRVPFLPNKDLLFVGLGLALAGTVAAPETEIAAVLVASTALLQITNLALFAATSFGGHRLGAPAQTR